MTEAHKDFLALMKALIRKVLIPFNCIIHQEALCAKSFHEEFTEVNKILAKLLNHSQCC